MLKIGDKVGGGGDLFGFVCFGISFGFSEDFGRDGKKGCYVTVFTRY